MQENNLQIESNNAKPVAYKAFSLPVKTENQDKKWAKVPNQPTPTEEERKTISMLDERWNIAKEAKNKKHDIWNFSYLQYKSVNHIVGLYGGWPSFWNVWGTGVFIPRTFETIESIKVQMNGRTPDFYIKPTLPRNTKEPENLNKLIHSEFDRSKTPEEVKETIHDALVYGTGLLKTDLINDIKEENVLKWKKNEDETMSINFEPEVVQKYYGVGAKRVDPYDFFPNPSSEAFKISKLGWCFERSVVDAWELREQYRILKEKGAYGVTDNWQYIKPGGDIKNYKYLRDEIDSLYGKSDTRYPGNISDLVSSSTLKPTDSNSKNQIELLEYTEDDRKIIITGTGLILRDMPNPYPHKKINYAKFGVVDCNEFFPMGIPEYMRWLQIAENVLYDEGLSNVIMSVHKMFAINSRYLEDESELVVRPHGKIHLKQIPNVKLSDAIMPIEYSQNMGNYFEFMRLNTQNIQTVTGVSPYQTGGITKESKVERATVANRLSFAGSARIREISRHLEESLVQSAVEQMVSIVQFYYQNADPFKNNGLPVEVKKGANKSYFVKFIPKSNGEITQQERDQAIQEGYVGIIAQDAIQGRYTVSVQGSSSLSTDPDEKGKLKLEFLKLAQGVTEMVKQQGVDPATGAPTSVEVPKPVFNIKKIAEEVAKDLFEIADPEDYMTENTEEINASKEITTQLPPPSEIVPPLPPQS